MTSKAQDSHERNKKLTDSVDFEDHLFEQISNLSARVEGKVMPDGWVGGGVVYEGIEMSVASPQIAVLMCGCVCVYWCAQPDSTSTYIIKCVQKNAHTCMEIRMSYTYAMRVFSPHLIICILVLFICASAFY